MSVPALHPSSDDAPSPDHLAAGYPPRPDGWVLVLPDATEAAVNVWAEGRSDDEAAHYADEIVDRVRAIAGG